MMTGRRRMSPTFAATSTPTLPMPPSHWIARCSRWAARRHLLLAVASLLASLAGGCHQGGHEAPKAEAPKAASGPAPQVVVVEAKLQPWPRTIAVQGSLLDDE